MNAWFDRLSRLSAYLIGSPYAFIVATASVVAWAAVGPVFEWSEGWQLVINTGTTILTFLMLFLIQYTQNTSDRAFQAKLDELIATGTASNRMLSIEDLTEEELRIIGERYRQLRETCEE